MALRLLGLGDNTIDTYVDRAEQYPGGNAVNVAVLARRLGAQAGYMGCLGDDEAGDILREALAAEGIDTVRCRKCPEGNARAFIAHNDGDRRFIRSAPGCRAEWGAFDRADRDYIAGYDTVHSSIFSGLEPHRAALRPAIRRWSFDFSEKWTPAILDDWMPLLDDVFLSHPLGSDEDVAALARFCAARGAQSVVITRGARGAHALRGKDGADCLPEPAEVVDTLGAGDAFIAGYLVGLHRRLALPDALSFAAQAAAEACGRFGAFGHGRPWRQSHIQHQP